MVNLSLQKRLAASVLKCGARKIWLDPSETNEISLANSRQNIRKLKKDGRIMKKPQTVHSRSRVTLRNEAKRKGRHTGKFNASSLASVLPSTLPSFVLVVQLALKR
jgi:large subunit ribosomal protein L19e